MYESKSERGRIAAVKTLDETTPSSWRELHTWKLLSHPNIVPLLEVYEEEKNHTLLAVMPVCGRDLEYLLRHSGYLIRTEESVRTIIAGVAAALNYLHTGSTHHASLIHGDVKLENIFVVLSDCGIERVYLGDYGFTRPAPDTTFEQRHTPNYVSPEQADYMLGLRAAMPGVPTTTTSVDQFALGVVMFALIYNHFPFPVRKDQRTSFEEYFIQLRAIDWSRHTNSLVLPPGWHPSSLHLLSRLFERDPAHRITSAQVLTHPWITGQHQPPLTLTLSLSPAPLPVSMLLSLPQISSPLSLSPVVLAGSAAVLLTTEEKSKEEDEHAPAGSPLPDLAQA